MFPECIDNTIRASAATCQTQAKYAYIENLALPGDSVHLLFGGAMARGLEVARRAYHDEHLSPSEAVLKGEEAAWDTYGDFEPPHKSPKTRENVQRAIRYYFTIWPLDSDPVQPTRDPEGNLRVEWTFKIPIPGLVHPDTQGPIYLTGRSDMIAAMSGMVVIEDDKTATQLGEKWGMNWRMDSQFMGYIWAAQQSGILVPNTPGTALVRGVGIYTPKYRKPGAESYAKKVTQEMIDSGSVEYDILGSFGHAQEVVTHSPWMIERWLVQLKKDINRLIYSYMNGEWDLALHKSACAGYNGCSFQTLCQAEHPEKWKEINFVKRNWDPLAVI